jgi:hypothetical protein
MNSKISNQSRLEVLDLPPDFATAWTNMGDFRPGDASALVVEVNLRRDINRGHADWRLPSFEELTSLVGSPQAQKQGWYWSKRVTAPCSKFCYVVSFPDGHRSINLRHTKQSVVLVRSAQ